MFDIAIIGAGPAGYSAAINARKREKSVIVIGQHTGWLSKAEKIENYPGMPDVSGPALLDAMRDQAIAMGALTRAGVVHQVIPMGESFGLSLGADFVEAKKIILCTGARQPKLLPGEEALLGRGVSYCGTCDGMLYRGKRVAVIAQSHEAITEANFLSGICESVTFFGKPSEYLDSCVEICERRVEAITGEDRAQGVCVEGVEMTFDGVFIFREAMALSALIEGLDTEGAFIRVDRQMRTSIPGVYAAGDCTGLPLQVAKAVGEGCVAALAAAQELK